MNAHGKTNPASCATIGQWCRSRLQAVLRLDRTNASLIRIKRLETRRMGGVARRLRKKISNFFKSQFVCHEMYKSETE